MAAPTKTDKLAAKLIKILFFNINPFFLKDAMFTNPMGIFAETCPKDNNKPKVKAIKTPVSIIKPSVNDLTATAKNKAHTLASLTRLLLGIINGSINMKNRPPDIMLMLLTMDY